MSINQWIHEHLSEVKNRYYSKKIKCAKDHKEHADLFYECWDAAIEIKNQKLKKVNQKLSEIFLYK